jgi:heme-degrading monooxygenase HmoA
MWVFVFACTVSSLFHGPGIAEDGTLDSEGPFVVAATYARPAKGQDAAFQAHVEAITDSLDAMDESSGLIGYSLRGELGGRDNWTATLWTSEEAMLTFVVGDVHAAAMADAGTVLEEAAFVHWEEADAGALPPDWDDLLERLEAAASY